MEAMIHITHRKEFQLTKISDLLKFASVNKPESAISSLSYI